MNTISIEELCSRIGTLPVIPAFLMRMLQHVDDPSIDIDRLVEDVRCDQGLAARVLRVANSSFYGLPGQVSSIKDAIYLIGTANLRSLALAAGMMQYLPHARGSGFDYRRFWKHGLGTALCAQAIARRTGQDDGGPFTAGLLHDIGQLVLAILCPEIYSRFVDPGAHEGFDLASERSVLGFDHARVGYELARRWRLPSGIRTAILRHHDPDEPPHDKLADLTHVACAYCPADTDRFPPPAIPRVSDLAIRRLDLDELTIISSAQDAEAELAKMALLLEG
jgi:putative nucleotidyltransferase with HDIG domain